jgi:hypothetical protein
MSSPQDVPQQRVNFAITPEVEVGTFANFVSVWHQPDCFVLDFSTWTQPPRLVEEEGQRMVNLSARVVSRVRIPPGQVFEIMKALENQLSAWERETGARTGPVNGE